MVIKRGYKFALAMMMLALYLVVTLASDVASLTCNCHHHLHAYAAHHAVAHTHHCECEAGHHDASHLACQGCGQQVSAKCCHCNHDHSTDRVLYVQPRNADDDLPIRYALSVAAIIDEVNDIDVQAAAVASAVSDRFLVPPLSAAHKGGDGLRAPPALV